NALCVQRQQAAKAEVLPRMRWKQIRFVYAVLGLCAQNSVLLFSGGETQMPNAKVLEAKKAVVAELTEKLQNAASGVLVDYKGITVAEDTALRNELRKNEVEYAVVKNTLTRFAVE